MMTGVVQGRPVGVIRGLCVSLIAGKPAAVPCCIRPAAGRRFRDGRHGRRCRWRQRTGGAAWNSGENPSETQKTSEYSHICVSLIGVGVLQHPLVVKHGNAESFFLSAVQIWLERESAQHGWDLLIATSSRDGANKPSSVGVFITLGALHSAQRGEYHEVNEFNMF